MVVPFIDHITSSRQVDMKKEAIGRIISGFDDLFSYWFFVSPSIIKSSCFVDLLVSNKSLFFRVDCDSANSCFKLCVPTLLW